jgi:hypothetical protein
LFVAGIVQRAHDLLAGPAFTDTIDALAEATARDDLRFRGRPSCTVLRPHFIHVRTWRRIRRVARTLAGLLDLVADRLAADAPMRRRFLQLCSTEFALVSAERRRRHPDPVSRLDGFLDRSGTFRVIESSSPPAGFHKMQRLAEAFARTRLIDRLRRQATFTTFNTLDAAASAFRVVERGRQSQPPAFAIVGPRVCLDDDGDDEMRNWFAHVESLGWPVHRVEADQLEFRRGVLLAAGHPVRVVLVIRWDGLEHLPRAHALLRAVRADAVWIWNGVRHNLRHAKAVLAILSDPRTSRFLPPRALAAVLPHVAWTRIVRAERTTWAGCAIDLPQLLSRERARFVLKPNIGSHGEGVVAGWSVTQQQWDVALRTALDAADTVGQFVAQERVDAEAELYPYLEHGALRFSPRLHSLDPFIWAGQRADGAFVRVGQGPVLNVGADPKNTATPLFAAAPRA